MWLYKSIIKIDHISSVFFYVIELGRFFVHRQKNLPGDGWSRGDLRAELNRRKKNVTAMQCVCGMKQNEKRELRHCCILQALATRRIVRLCVLLFGCFDVARDARPYLLIAYWCFICNTVMIVYIISLRLLHRLIANIASSHCKYYYFNRYMCVIFKVTAYYVQFF